MAPLQALQFEGGTHIVASGALATLSGAKTGRSPRDKRVVREPASEKDIWWAAPDGQASNGAPNYEMDERWAPQPLQQDHMPPSRAHLPRLQS